MTIPGPYLLYLGDARDEISVKTSRGVAVFRPDLSLGEYRRTSDAVTLGLPQMSFAAAASAGAKTLILGVANAGGVLGDEAVEDVVEALEAGLNVAAGLHDRLQANPKIRAAADRTGRQLFDVREPPASLRVGAGVPRAGRRLLTVGTDCSVGKMYTTLALARALAERGVPADFRATGQTGILVAGAGMPVDAVVADFISGSVEMISPARHDGGWDLIEGQGSLFHPSYAGVSLGLLHGAQPDAIVLCHEPGRASMRGLPGRGLPELQACLDANLAAARLTNPDVIAVGVALNTSKLDAAAARDVCAATSEALGLPCQDPFSMGVDLIIDRLNECFGLSTPQANTGR
ncbi:N-acetyltransferase DgcN [Phenylobacterium sp.]|uniref:N-acetyltransferase DgcN n=1 Tax=Phenylobacterium sp. TaxID=1871053 RepID=UPI0025E8771B|nr:N-acetyltransferase DgcN [Phenylobacterium sp.]